MRGYMFVVTPIMVMLASCGTPSNEREVIGTYVADGYIRTADTLLLQPAGVYQRRVYSSDGRLVLEMNSTWELRADGEIVLQGFYLNLDDDLVQFPELAADTGYQVNTHIRQDAGALLFCVGHYEGKNCYRRVPR